jgi:N-acetylglucosaminyl-diphospho-decaprenol L-rhamnosyltransferase
VNVVSVLIVNYRAYEELGRCLGSIQPEVAGGRAEAIVVDNASDPDALASLERQFPETVFIANSGNPGFAAAVNQAATRARGAQFLLLNPDATLLPEALSRMERELESDRRIAVVGARVFDPDGTLQASARHFPTIWTGLFGRTSLLTRLRPRNRFSRRHLIPPAASTIDVDWVAGSCAMFRGEAFRELGGLDEGFFLYWEDADFCRRARDRGWRCVYAPVDGAVHQVGRSSRHATIRSIVAFHRSAFRYELKHRQGRSRWLLLPFAAGVLTAHAAIRIVSASLRPKPH